jgi:DNA-binding response OmpR family regulator
MNGTRPAYHVIVADDEIGIRALVARIVARIYPSVKLSEAPDGLSAFIIYTECGADLVITDDTMPVLDGWRLLEWLRGITVTLPVIVLSSNPLTEPQSPTLQASALLAKPFNIRQLERLLISVLPP